MKTALEYGRLLAERQIGARELAQSFMDKISSGNGKYNAVLRTCGESALSAADEAQKRLDVGAALSPIDGVPVLVKDNISTKGIKTTCASKMLADYVPPYDAAVIEKLRNAGAVIIGKTNMDEFAMGSTSETGYFGAVSNPWDASRVAGGSSGGSAASVALGFAPLALGSDTGGSIRQPASYCGVTGIKPTYGAVSRYGLIAYASSLDQIGALSIGAGDLRAALDIMTGIDKRDMTSADALKPSAQKVKPIGEMRVALPKEYFGEGLDDGVAKCVLSAAKELEKMGAKVSECSLSSVRYAVPAYYIIACAEASSNLSRYDGIKYGMRAEKYEDLSDMYEKTRSEGFGAEVKRRIRLGAFALSSGYYDAYYLKALKVRSIIKQAFYKVLEDYDMILCPASPVLPPEKGESLADPMQMYLSDIYTVSVNLAGLPGLTMPCGFCGGLPVGCQLIGRAFEENALLTAAEEYQKATDFHLRAAKEAGL
ncbi:MAG: Asp-tRNA(Asn)/Glu-tRNA(Gln) amidotransferase subunit GatA [Eubacteriales bacterium]|nr:Asp-tRNA(Asn)/Glu-tRNA(Gln) amidotransferase subunit GatA [Eubacteriales bacterium]MDD3881618.1 Asp-tRNA(Asn)/Glu-tRNA(Gln) amidotransferase subunit GatA [Eubacteriales bacterium]MDD4512323.1 Asp-tRNA(Asn)/Glu-tRNA(Gln) amidotransferase subunit GatA [Eubacteriales bacterium]